MRGGDDSPNPPDSLHDHYHDENGQTISLSLLSLSVLLSCIPKTQKPCSVVVRTHIDTFWNSIVKRKWDMLHLQYWIAILRKHNSELLILYDLNHYNIIKFINILSSIFEIIIVTFAIFVVVVNS